MNRTVYGPGCECGAGPSTATDLGIEVSEVYDGILIWECGHCGTLRPRALEGRLHAAALDIIRRWQEQT